MVTITVGAKDSNTNLNTNSNKMEDKAQITVHTTDTSYTITITYPRYKVVDSSTNAEIGVYLLTHTIASFALVWKQLMKNLSRLPTASASASQQPQAQSQQLQQPVISFDDEKTKAEFKRLFNEGNYSKLMNDETLAELYNMFYSGQFAAFNKLIGR